MPSCAVIQVLAHKVDERRDIDLDFLAHLNLFREKVSQEVRFINSLFPEYTPHDEQYHLKRLFHVADTVLGENRLETMNSAELLILSIALYGHDWGMAVSEIEKEYISQGTIPEGMSPPEVAALSADRQSFLRFARAERLAIDTTGKVENLDVDLWREYVRGTHALRSGERVRAFFSRIDGGLAESSARVCRGHWISFEDLEDYASYPPDFSVLRETVNLRALAIYLRLIDLLDLGEDRTPYVIWKFVAPRNKYSRMEWEKHRALQPITCPSYQEGRVVRVDGRTDDHRVFAALQDLRIYCEGQLRACNDILARMNDPRHRLDIYHIDWRISPLGFRPISVQFGFDRERMFEILGAEIYRGDCHVFLRELLQNSIDAIRLRREILLRNKINPDGIGVIRVSIESKDDGDAIITWADDGVGMDEHVISKYLSVAGKSYYSSTDFDREGIQMDPISRFGIGILSCFTVANRIEIQTFKEPYFPPSAEPLKIIVEDMRRQFRIETCPREGAEVGTSVKVFVEGKKMPANEQVRVTDYLSIVAGFVEYPIIVEEGQRKTMILHPKHDPQPILRRFVETYKVQQLNLGYKADEIFSPQDVAGALNALDFERFDIRTDLGLTEYEGEITCVVPKANVLDLVNVGHCWPVNEIEATVRTDGGTAETRVRWDEASQYVRPYFDERGEHREASAISRSSANSVSYSVYRAGILIASAPRPDISWFEPEERTAPHYWMFHNLPVPRIVANISQSRAPQVDLARTEILGKTENWAKPIWEGFSDHVCSVHLGAIQVLPPSDRLFRLAWLLHTYRIHPKAVWQRFPEELWPMPFFTAADGIQVTSLG